MKRICLIFNHFRHQDGVGRAALAIANALAKQQLADVTLIPIYTDEKDFHKLLVPNIRVKHIFGFFFHGLPHIVDKLPLRWINNVIRPQEYDILIGFQYGLSIRCVAAAKTDEKVLKLAWMHGYDYGLVLRKEYETIGKVICVSKCNAQRLQSELPTIQTDYSYNPTDEIIVQKSAADTITIEKPSTGLLFVCVGRLSPEKGYGRLIHVLKRLKSDGFIFCLWVIGDGPLEGELHNIVDKLDMNDCVKFLGRQNNPHKFTSRADVFICSSFSEGYSTVCTEAIMMGVPVVTTNVSGAEEIIDDAESGMVVGMKDEDLYNGLHKVLEDNSLVEEWKNKLKTTRRRFYAGARIQRLVKILGL